MITVRKKDETTLFFDSEDSGVLQEIYEFFTFFVPGYKWMPAFRNRMWDGKIRLANLKARTLPAGLLFHLANFAQERGYQIIIDDAYAPPDKASVAEKMEFVSLLKLHTNGKEIALRDYQRVAIEVALTNHKAVLVSPTGSGKSLIIYALVREFLRNNSDGKKFLIVVPTTALTEQLRKDFIDYATNDDGFDADKATHVIYSGKEKVNIQAPVVITTWQSAYTMPAVWFKQFGAVVGDEAHLFKAQSLTKIMNSLVDAKLRIGTTGTLDGAIVHKLVLEGSFGPVFQVTTTQTLIDADTLAQLKINVLALKYPEAVRKSLGKLSYQEEIGFIVGYEPRNNFIANLAIDQGGNTLILFNLVEKHGMPLHELVKKKAGQSRSVHYIAGSVETESREAIRSIVEKEKNAIIVASMGTFSVGVNIRNLHNIIIAAPTKSQVRLLQSIGRGLRKSDDGRPTTVFDLSDDLCWKKRKNYTFNHALDRINIYRREKFKFEIHSVPLP